MFRASDPVVRRAEQHFSELQELLALLKELNAELRDAFYEFLRPCPFNPMRKVATLSSASRGCAAPLRPGPCIWATRVQTPW